MRPRSPLLLLPLAVMVPAATVGVVSCASTKLQSTSLAADPSPDGSPIQQEEEEDADTPNDSGAGTDAKSGKNDGAPQEEDTGASCIAKRVTSADDCLEDCDARLLLPSGDYYCSHQCDVTADCADLGSNLTCPGAIGACVPRCTNNASCTAAGFLRCDVDAGGCDTVNE